MKKTLDIFLIILTFLIIYFLQSNFFTWFNIAGVMPNLFIILITIMGLFLKKEYGFGFGIVFGLLLDFLIGSRIGINTITFGLVGLTAGILDKNFSKDNKLTLMSIVGFLTFLAELMIYIIEIIFLKVQFNFIAFIKIIAIEIVLNILLVIIFYPLIIRFGNNLENDFINNNKFLNFLH